MVTYLEESDLLIKYASKTLEKATKKKRRWIS